MDTPAKDNFLETIRELRREADEKLTGNRHYLAIQKLDEIAEAVQRRNMSSEELGAVSEVLRGDAAKASHNGEETSAPDSAVDLAATAAGVAGAAVAAGTAASMSGTPSNEPLEEVAEQAALDPDDEKSLPNWWKDKEGGVAPAELDASTPDVEPEIETIAQSTEESSLDLTDLAVGAGVTGIAAGVVADQLSSETVEIVEEIELIDVPEVEIEAGDVELPAIEIDTIEPEADLPEVAPEVAPQIEHTDIETMAPPEIELADEIAQVPETIEVAALPEVASEPVGLVVENRAEDIVMPEIEIADIPEISVPDTSAQIADLLSDVDADTQAVVAAGAAAAATIGVAGITMQEEPVVPEPVELVEAQPAEAPEAPEKLSFPSVPETSQQEVVQPVVAALPAAKILNGDTIARHPTYGGNRGGILKRFANSLRGKDFI